MFLRKEPSGIYHLYYNAANGKRTKISTQSSRKSHAISFMRSFNVQAKFQSEESISEISAKVCGILQRTHSVKTIKSLKSASNQFIIAIGDIKASSVESKHMEFFLSSKKKATQWSMLKYYRAINSIYNHAIRLELLNENPFKKVIPPRPAPVPPLYMSVDDIQNIFKIMNPSFRRLCTFALVTGMRMGELLNLKWEHIDLANKRVLVQNTRTFYTKNKRNRVIPLSDIAISVLAEIHERREYVFMTELNLRWTENYATHMFKRCVLNAKLNPRYHFHTLRHTFASWLVQKGVNIYEVKELLGHSNITTTQIYAHLEPETLHNTVNKISIPTVMTPLG